QPPDAHVAAGGAVVAVGGVGPRLGVGAVAPHGPILPVVARVDRAHGVHRAAGAASAGARVHAERLVAVGVVAFVLGAAVGVRPGGLAAGGVVGVGGLGRPVGMQGDRHAPRRVIGRLGRGVEGVGAGAIPAVGLLVDRAAKAVHEIALAMAIAIRSKRL